VVIADQATNDGANVEEESEEEDVGSGGGPEHLIIEDGFLEFADKVREHFDSRYDLAPLRLLPLLGF
jgi:hypothetical protein